MTRVHIGGPRGASTWELARRLAGPRVEFAAQRCLLGAFRQVYPLVQWVKLEVSDDRDAVPGNGVSPQDGKKNLAPVWRSVPVVLGVVALVAVGFLTGLHPAGHSIVSVRLLGHDVVVARGGLSSIFTLIPLVLVGVMLPAWAIIHATRTPKHTFTSLGRSKGRWVASMIIVFLIGDASLLLLPLYYLIRVRPQLNRQRAIALV